MLSSSFVTWRELIRERRELIGGRKGSVQPRGSCRHGREPQAPSTTTPVSSLSRLVALGSRPTRSPSWSREPSSATSPASPTARTPTPPSGTGTSSSSSASLRRLVCWICVVNTFMQLWSLL